MKLIPWRSKKDGGEIRPSESSTSITRFRDEVDRLFDRLFEDPFGMIREPLATPGGWAPTLDVVESDKEVMVRAEVPGMDPKDIDITVSGNVLTLSGEKRDSVEDKGDNWYHCERRFGTFRRNVQLPSYVDMNKVSAEHANGVLTIHIDKVSSAAPKKVTVKPAAT